MSIWGVEETVTIPPDEFEIFLDFFSQEIRKSQYCMTSDSRPKESEFSLGMMRATDIILRTYRDIKDKFYNGKALHSIETAEKRWSGLIKK